jgi:hypothetical protein
MAATPAVGVTECTLYFWRVDPIHLRDDAEPVEREPAKGMGDSPIW